MPSDAVVGVVLAGGQSSRMGGGDKCLKQLGSRTLLGHVLDRLRPQVAAMVLNANGDAARFDGYDVQVVADSVPDFAGPLAGILAGLDWARTMNADWAVSTAADAPFLPRDLVDRLQQGRDAARIAVAASGGWRHPTTALWPVDLADELRKALQAGERKIDRFTARYAVAPVTFDTDPVDPFFNINTPEELAEAVRLLPLVHTG
jgi:molybdopterin-guanine dinucleotide biosynthesis protein A